MGHSTKSPTPSALRRKRRASTKDSHQNPDCYVDRGPYAPEYEPLDPAKDEIRLLRVKPPAQPDDPIDCRLFHSSLASAPPYRALSYTWGGRAIPQTIELDSRPATITPNLNHALQRLRPKEGEDDLILWVDALCINQTDIHERNVQTAKMRKIYQNAESVFVWVGVKNRGSELAMQLALDLNRCPKEEIPSVIRDPLNAAAFDALVVLFRRQYWWRIWVIQEVSCAKKCTVYCGQHSISWPALENTCDILRLHEDELQDIYYTRPSYVRTLTHGGPKSLLISRYSPTASAPPLFDLLISHKSKQSTDPRDKVYPLVGISNSRETFGEIDYSQSLREVFSHTARHVITTSKRLDIICVKQHNINQFDLPTWVPDWTRAPSREGQTIIGLHHHEPLFSAGGDSSADTTFKQDGYVLQTSGLILDHIKIIGLPLKKLVASGDVNPTLSAFNDWWKIFVGFKDDSTQSRELFARCISCGNWPSDEDESCTAKLKAIFDLSKSGRASLYSGGAGPTSNFEDPNYEQAKAPEGEKAQVATVLTASLTMNRRTLFISDSITGLAPWDSEPGDLVCVLPGCRFPVVLRKQKRHYILVGEAYVDGYMNGEAMDGLRDEEFRLETFEIH